MQEQRRAVRCKVLHNMKIFERKTDQLVGFLEDISSQGLMMVRMAPLPQNTMMNLKMELDETLCAGGEFRFRVRIVWCRQKIKHNYYEIGCRFEKLETGGPETLEKIIRAPFLIEG